MICLAALIHQFRQFPSSALVIQFSTANFHEPEQKSGQDFRSWCKYDDYLLPVLISTLLFPEDDRNFCR